MLRYNLGRQANDMHFRNNQSSFLTDKSDTAINTAVAT